MLDFALWFPAGQAQMMAACEAAGMVAYDSDAGGPAVIVAAPAYAFRWIDDPEVMAPYGGGVAAYMRRLDGAPDMPAALAPHLVPLPAGAGKPTGERGEVGTVVGEWKTMACSTPRRWGAAILSFLLIRSGRITDIPNRPGQWGEVLSSICAMGWELALMFNADFPAAPSPLVAVVDLVGREALEVWVGLLVVTPIIGIAANCALLRVVGSIGGQVTWSYMFLLGLSHVYQGPMGSLGFYFAMFLACLNANYRFLLGMLKPSA